MRLPLATLEIFDAIAQTGSFRAAARRLGVTPSTVSHQLKTLETQLGVPLFIRTTRAVSLTEAGRMLHAGAGPAFEQLADAVEAARNSEKGTRGRLRLTLPEFVYDTLLGPALPSFHAQHPEITLDLSLSDAMEDILTADMHAGFRMGDRIAPDMIALRLGPTLRVSVLGSPDYLSRAGQPQSPADLLDHSCIRYRFASSGALAPWQFHGAEGSYQVEVAGPLIANSLPASVDMARRGMGLVYTFTGFCAQELARGDLIEVLSDHALTLPAIHIYFPREYRKMAALRLLVDHLKAYSASADR